MQRTLYLHILNIIGSLFTATFCAATYAGIYPVSTDDLDWQTDEKKYFHCRLEQNIPLFGTLAIQASAGRVLTIELQSSLFSSLPESVRLQLNPIPWGQHSNQQSLNPRAISEIPISNYELLSNVNTEGLVLSLNIPFRQLLQDLNSHSRLQVLISPGTHSTNRYPGSAKHFEVSIPTTGILPKLTEVSDCLVSLLPRNYDELKQYNIYYTEGQKLPGPKQKQWLADTVRYLQVDDTIEGITINGHSDSLPFKQANPTLSRLKNLELSEERAENVSTLLKEYIRDANISRHITITVKHHGERYPIADNTTTVGRSKNRRVEVALKRKTTITKEQSMEMGNKTDNKNQQTES